MASDFVFRDPNEEFTLDVKLELIGMVLTALFSFVWLPFHRHRVTYREHANQTAQLLTEKNDEIKNLHIQLHKLQTTINDDAPKLVPTAELQVNFDPTGHPHFVLWVKVINQGKKLVRVEQVVYYNKGSGIYAPHEEYMVCASSPMAITVDIQPDGDIHFWKASYFDPKLLATEMKDGKEVGYGYVKIGMGNKFHFTFDLLTRDRLKTLTPEHLKALGLEEERKFEPTASMGSKSQGHVFVAYVRSLNRFKASGPK